jgi:hypothetical protein
VLFVNLGFKNVSLLPSSAASFHFPKWLYLKGEVLDFFEKQLM